MYKDNNGIYWGGRACPHCKCGTTKLKNQPKTKKELECIECSTKFIANRATQKFCSIKCRNKYHQQKVKQKTKVNKIKYIKTCPTCDIEFETFNKHKVYCKSNHHPASIAANKKRKYIEDFKQPISKFFKKYIVDIYLKRPKGFEVDHIIPLNHPDVCGLHVPWNLQIIPKEVNNKKSNKFNPNCKKTLRPRFKTTKYIPETKTNKNNKLNQKP